MRARSISKYLCLQSSHPVLSLQPCADPPPSVPPCRVLDTALLFPHPLGPPAKCALRVLCAKHLRRTIQKGSHDSAEDARTALELVWLKVHYGERVLFLNLSHGPAKSLHSPSESECLPSPSKSLF